MIFFLKLIGDSAHHFIDTSADPEQSQAIEKIVEPGGVAHEHRPPDNKSDADQYNTGYNIADPLDAFLGLFFFGGNGLRIGDIIDIGGI